MATPDLPVHSNQIPQLSSRGGVSLREDTAYTSHNGKQSRGIRKRTDKAIDKLQGILGKVLEPGETILYVALGQAPATTFEQMTLGWSLQYITKTVLVLTNRRLLHFQVNRNLDWKRRLRTLHWGDLAEATVKGSLLNRTLELKYRSGKKETYWGLRFGDAKKIKVLLAVLLPANLGGATSAQAMLSLCPNCLAGLTPQVYQCSRCFLSFRDEKTMVRRSLLIPGGGYFYAGERFLGICDFIAEAYISIWLLIWVLVAFGVMPEPELKPGETPATMGVALFAAAFVAMLLILEKWLTIHHCRRLIREFVPAK